VGVLCGCLCAQGGAVVVTDIDVKTILDTMEHTGKKAIEASLKEITKPGFTVLAGDFLDVFLALCPRHEAGQSDTPFRISPP
jgi:Flp pilus assembly protein CpaB